MTPQQTKEEERGRSLSYRIFHIREIESNTTLQALFYAIVASFFVTFFGWVDRSTVSISTFLTGNHICPPRFPDCGEYYFLEALPYGYTQNFFYVLLFLVLLYGVYAAVRKDWVIAHRTLLLAFIWKVIYIFALSYGAAGNYDYYDLGLAFVWLFLREKEYFAKVVFATFYFIASTIKIDEGWILGNYFSATIAGAPFFSDAVLPVFTNLVILMQMVGAWLLFSKNTNVQRLAFAYFFLFHAYSGILVTYRYITISIPALVILFGQNVFRVADAKDKNVHVLGIGRKTAFGYVFVLLLVASQFVGIAIPGNQKKTLEGNYFGLYMFEANHQCLSTANIHFENGRVTERIDKNATANNRCNPYDYWYKLQTRCIRNPEIARISWTFDHSINGHPFERIVSVDDACSLEYHSLSHNPWIKIDGEAEVLDRPVFKNGYGRRMYDESRVIPTHPTESPYLPGIKRLYWSIWSGIFLFLVYRVVRSTKLRAE